MPGEARALGEAIRRAGEYAVRMLMPGIVIPRGRKRGSTGGGEAPVTPTIEGESTLLLHFSGHGDSSRSSVPVLQHDITELASARDALAREDTTKVVFINACQSGIEASHDWVGGGP